MSPAVETATHHSDISHNIIPAYDSYKAELLAGTRAICAGSYFGCGAGEAKFCKCPSSGAPKKQFQSSEDVYRVVLDKMAIIIQTRGKVCQLQTSYVRRTRLECLYGLHDNYYHILQFAQDGL